MIQTIPTKRHFTLQTALVTASALLGLLAVASACGSSDESEPTVTTAVSAGTDKEETTVSDPNSGSTPNTGSEEQTLFVGPELIDCEGVGPQTCLQVRRSPTAEWELFYDQIEGFSHELGTSYELVVEVSNVEDPPADGSSLRYRLISVVSATPGS